MNKKAAVVLAGAAIAAGAGFWTIKTRNQEIQVPAYKAIRVADGDTFDTSEEQIIRLAGIDAPEISNCGGAEAKQKLEKLIMGKKLYIKVIFRDNYRRLVAWVYTDEGLVNKKMLEAGMGEIDGSYPETSAAGSAARNNGVGIFGPKCVQQVNPVDKNCDIKGNVVPKQNKAKEYRFPGCGQYGNTIVQLYQGDRWFCTEAEAEKAGFSKGSDCAGKKYVR